MKKALPVLFMVILMSLSGVAAAQPSDSCAAEPEDMTTSDGVEFVRTPDACFENLPDWPYEPQYVEIDGLRQAYVDVGTGESGETILLLHGQPSWSYLYRHMIPVLADAGHRVIAMDHLGFGRSDKPIDPDYYTYVDHVERLETFIEELELEGITPFVQDWGSLIGLQVVGTNPDWFDRLVVGNGFLPTYAEGETLFELPENPEMTRNLFHQTMTNTPAQQEPLVRDESGFGTFELNDFDLEALDLAALDLDVFDADANYFGIWIDYSRNDERFRPEVIVEAQTYFDLTPEEEAAYAAPFPSREYMGGARAFPGLVNQLGGVTDSGWAGLGEFDKPFLTIWGDNDGGNLGQPFVQGALLLHIPGSEGWDHVRLEEASHFLQDDQGEEIARRMNEFIAQSSEQVANPQQALPDSEEARRNCELHVITMEEGQLVFNVWHTLNLNNCPPDAWAAIDTDAIQEEMGALAVMKDGPRYALAESASFEGLTDEVVTRTFGTLEMQLFAQIELSMEDMAAQGGSADGGQTSYAPSAIQRTTAMTYDAGDTVYVIVDAEGTQYIMISYSQEIDPTLNRDDLLTLNDRLTLPDGWHYEVITLENTLEVVADGLTTVLSDEFVNVYQVVNEPIVTGDACFVEPEVMATAEPIEFVRTSDACFENLPDWPFEAQYVEISGLRQGYVDVGSGESGETILLLHGQPSW